MREDLLDALLEAQANAWAKGNCIEVERLIAGTPPAEIDDELLKWLLVGEIKLRRDRGDSSQLLVEIESRFPKLASDVWEFVEFSNSLTVEPRERQGSISPPENSAIGAAAAGSGEETTLLNGKGFLSDASPAETPNNRRDPTKPDSRPLTTTKKGGTGTFPHLDDYELFRELGRGGFGAVYLGKNRHDNSLAAVKFVSNYGDVEIEGLRALRRCSADHPSLTPILYVGKRPGFLIYTMPLANSLNHTTEESTPSLADLVPESWANYVAHSLSAELKLRRRLTVDQSLELLRTLLAGLVELHQHQVIHSDVKPANILRIGSTWKLADMGLAIVNESGDKGQSRRGTQAYWPANKETGTVAHDLFATGITLWSCLTGQSATDFPGRTARLTIDPTIPAQDRGIAKQLFHVINGICQTPGSEPITTASAALNQLPAPSSHRIERRRFFWRMAAAATVLCTGTAAGMMMLAPPESKQEPAQRDQVEQPQQVNAPAAEPQQKADVPKQRIPIAELEAIYAEIRSNMTIVDRDKLDRVITICDAQIAKYSAPEWQFNAQMVEHLQFLSECRQIANSQKNVEPKSPEDLSRIFVFEGATLISDYDRGDTLLANRGNDADDIQRLLTLLQSNQLLSEFVGTQDPNFVLGVQGMAFINRLRQIERELAALAGDLDRIAGASRAPVWHLANLSLRFAARLRIRLFFVANQSDVLDDQLKKNGPIFEKIQAEHRRIYDLCEQLLNDAEDQLMTLDWKPNNQAKDDFGPIAISRSWRNLQRIRLSLRIDAVEFLGENAEGAFTHLNNYLEALSNANDDSLPDQQTELILEQCLAGMAGVRLGAVVGNLAESNKYRDIALDKRKAFEVDDTRPELFRRGFSIIGSGRVKEYQHAIGYGPIMIGFDDKPLFDDIPGG